MKRPIAEISSRMGEKNEIGVLAPKLLFKPLDKSMHYSDIKNVRMYTYSVVNLPLSSEWPIPITPMFFVNLFRVFWRYDIVHIWTYFYLSSVWALLFRRLFFWRKRTILTMDTLPGYSFDMPGFINVLMKIYGKLFGWFIFMLPDKITLYGESLKKYGKMIGMPMKKTQALSTGIDIEKFSGAYKDVRKGLGISKDETFLLFVGLVVPRKGVDIIIDTIDELRDEKIKMVIVGDGPDRIRYEKEVEKRGLSDKIIFTGKRKDVKDLYRSADIFFFPSRGEGLAGVIMEAMASGLPVVTSNIPCTPDLLSDGKEGYLCEIEDVECYVNRIKELMDKKRREEKGKKGKESIKKLDWDAIIKKYDEMYGELR